MTENNFDFYVSNIKYIYDKSFEAELKEITHFYTHYTVALCTEGEGLYTIGNINYTFKKGDCLFFPKNSKRTFSNANEREWHYITIAFEISSFNQQQDFIFDSINNFYHNTSYELQNLFKKISKEWTGRSLGYKFTCRTIIQEIISHMIQLSKCKKYQPSHYKQIEDARIYIQNHIKENIDINQIIADSNLSPAHFRRLFKQIVGYSPKNYYNYIKLMQSKDLLKSGMYTVSEVASEMGYSSLYYFSEAFKKYFNVSPNNYIKSKKGIL